MSKQKLRKSFSKLGSQDTGETDQVCRGILEHVRLVSKTLQAEHPQALIVISQSQSWRIWEGKMEWFHCGGVCWPSTTHRTFPEFRQARMDREYCSMHLPLQILQSCPPNSAAQAPSQTRKPLSCSDLWTLHMSHNLFNCICSPSLRNHKTFSNTKIKIHSS